MEREDSKEHADSNCNPVVEGGFFLKAMQQIEAKRVATIAASKNQKENIDAKQANSPAKKQGNDSDADIREDEEDKAVSNVQNIWLCVRHTRILLLSIRINMWYIGGSNKNI